MVIKQFKTDDKKEKKVIAKPLQIPEKDKNIEALTQRVQSQELTIRKLKARLATVESRLDIVINRMRNNV